jgi:hypothetical protein
MLEAHIFLIESNFINIIKKICNPHMLKSTWQFYNLSYKKGYILLKFLN